MPRATYRERVCSKCRLAVIPAGQVHDYCRPCARTAAKESRDRLGRDHGTRLWRQREYGMSDDAFRAMVEAQGGLCAICREPETAMRGGVVRPLCIDHDHETGGVRGLLCSRCNTAVGLMLDDPARLRAAVAYLTIPRLLDPSRELEPTA